MALAAYLDDSGTDGQNAVVMVGGVIADDSLIWPRIEVEWNSFLNDFGLRRFHATTYWARQRPYSNWSNDQYDACAARIEKILESKCSGMFVIVKGVAIEAFSEWRSGLAYYRDPDPYFFCLERCLRFFIRGVSKSYGPDDGIAIYVDRDPGREKLGKELAKWQEARLRTTPIPHHVRRDRRVHIDYADSVFCKPLQIADVAVHSAFRMCRTIMRDGRAENDQPFLAALERGGVPCGIDLLHSVELLEIASRSQLVRGVEG